MVGVHRAGAQEGVAEGLHDGGHGVGEDDPLEAGGDGRDRVDHRGGVHQELDAEAHQEAQVTVLGGERGDDDAESQSQAGHHQHQQRREGDPGPVGLDRTAAQDEVDHEYQEEGELDQEGDQVGDQDGDRHGQAREVHLAEQAGVLDEGVGGLVQAVGEIRPHHRPGHVEEELG